MLLQFELTYDFITEAASPNYYTSFLEWSNYTTLVGMDNKRNNSKVLCKVQFQVQYICY